MSRLDASLIQGSLAATSAARIESIEVFSSIASTNTHLLSQAGPSPGRMRVAVADFQTSGRGRHQRRWLSPPGAGLCLSIAYTFAEQRDDLPALTLAIGVGIVAALRALDVDDVGLKWPNDIVAADGKLGGVLTEMQSGNRDDVTVVTGIGLNVDLPAPLDFGAESGWSQRPVDLKRITADPPRRELIAAELVGAVHIAMATFEAQGFAAFVDDWRESDWLAGREVVVELDTGQVRGIAAGVDHDGALLVDTGAGKTRIITGSIVLPEFAGDER